MPVRKIDLELIPEELRPLARQKPVLIILGDSIYEMGRLTNKDMARFMENIAALMGEVGSELAKKSGTDAGSISSPTFWVSVKDSLIASGAYKKLLVAALDGVEEEDFTNADMAQMLDAMQKFYDLHFTNLPETARGTLGKILSVFVEFLKVAASEPGA